MIRRFAMPLKAKIDPRKLPFLPRLQSTAATAPADEEALFRNLGAVREVTLNRPRKLNAITLKMCELIIPRLLEYSKSDLAGIIVVKGAGGKALCAGGDVGSLAAKAREQGLENAGPENGHFFAVEFGLDHLIGTYRKPVVSFWDGIVMGGGVGLTVHGPFRIATERTLWSMPETSIGYYPDCGLLFFLNKLGGELGLYFALTSARVSGYDAYRLGLATHYIPSNKLASLQDRLSELTPTNHCPADHRDYFRLVNSSLEDFSGDEPAAYAPALSDEMRKTIDACFRFSTMEEIISELQKDGSDFALQTIKTLRERSPLSLKVTLAAYRQISHLDFRSAIEREMEICHHFARSENFVEGVGALLLDKRKAIWHPSTIEDVTESDIQALLSPLKAAEPVDFLNDETFEDYRHNYGLPKESDLKAFVTGETSPSESKATRNDVIEYFRSRTIKAGLDGYIDSVLARKCKPDPEHPELLDWIY